MRKTLLVIVGPTAVGKTALSIDVALHFKTIILSADSRQFYKELNAGTAKPTAGELSRVSHYFINNLSIFDDYNIADFESAAYEKILHFFDQYDLLVLTGGSGLYVDAVCHGLDDIPKIDPDIREALNDRFSAEGLKPLQQQLMEFDPVYYQQVDRQNPKRVIRALEVCITTGQPYSSFLTKEKKTRPFEIIKIGLELDRQLLYERINYRMDKMIENGLFEEARKLYPHKNLNALQTVGYTEIFHYLEGKYDRAEAIRLLKRNSRRYAKRQLTWFKKDQDIQWFQSGQKTQILRFLETKLKNSD